MQEQVTKSLVYALTGGSTRVSVRLCTPVKHASYIRELFSTCWTNILTRPIMHRFDVIPQILSIRERLRTKITQLVLNLQRELLQHSKYSSQ